MCNPLKPFPAGLIQQVLLLGIQSRADKVDLGNDTQQLVCSPTILQLDQQVNVGPFILEALPGNLALLVENRLKLPELLIFILLLLDVVQYFLVRHDLFKLIMITLDTTHDKLCIIVLCQIYVIYALNNLHPFSCGVSFLRRQVVPPNRLLIVNKSWIHCFVPKRLPSFMFLIKLWLYFCFDLLVSGAILLLLSHK